MALVMTHPDVFMCSLLTRSVLQPGTGDFEWLGGVYLTQTHSPNCEQRLHPSGLRGSYPRCCLLDSLAEQDEPDLPFHPTLVLHGAWLYCAQNISAITGIIIGTQLW